MAARLTDKQKKKIVADYLDTQSVNATAKRNGVSWDSAKKAIEEVGDIEKKLEEKKAQNSSEILAYMENKRNIVCQIIEKGLDILNDPEKISEASPSQITTALGTLIDKWAQYTNNGTISPDMAEDNRILEQMFKRGDRNAK